MIIMIMMINMIIIMIITNNNDNDNNTNVNNNDNNDINHHNEVPMYIFFCLLYTLSFIANVHFGDASRWFRTSTTTLLKMSVIIPLMLAFK